MVKNTEYIRSFEGRIIGMVETDENGDKTARDFASRRVLGFYKKKYDQTLNFIGRVVANGDAVVSFIYNKDFGK